MGAAARLKQNLGFAVDVLKPKSSTLVYASGWLGFNNLGDEVLLAADRKLFPSHHFSYFNTNITPALLNLMSGPRAALLAGGTLINGNRSWLDSFQTAAQACGRSFVFGSGVQDPAFWEGRFGWTDFRDAWVPVLEKCAYVGVRGPRSVELLQDAGFQDVEMIGDPVLVYADGAALDPRRSEKGILGLNIGQSGGKLWGDEATLKAEAVVLAKQAKADGWKVEWFVIWPKDKQITEEAAAASGTSETIHCIYNDHLEYLEKVGRCDFFVGVKLHAVVLAICAWVPSIMLEYRPKCRDFMLSVGQGDASMRADEFRAAEIMDLLNRNRGKRSAWVDRLSAVILPLVEKQKNKAAELSATLFRIGDV